MRQLQGIPVVQRQPIGGDDPYGRVDSLAWSDAERKHGKAAKIKDFPKEHKVKRFRVMLSIVRNHSACATLVWVCRKPVAWKTGQTTCTVKQGLLSDDMPQHSRSPTATTVLA